MKKKPNIFDAFAVPKSTAYIVSQEEFNRIKNSKKYEFTDKQKENLEKIKKQIKISDDLSRNR